MEKMMAIIGLLRKGSSLADPALWKSRQIGATALAVFIVALARTLAAFGVDLHVDEDTATTIAGGIIACVNIVLTYATSDKVGLLGEAPAVPTPLSDADIAEGRKAIKRHVVQEP